MTSSVDLTADFFGFKRKVSGKSPPQKIELKYADM